MTSEAMRNGNKLHFENLLFSKKGTPSKRAGVRTPWTPPLDPPLLTQDNFEMKHTVEKRRPLQGAQKRKQLLSRYEINLRRTVKL